MDKFFFRKKSRTHRSLKHPQKRIFNFHWKDIQKWILSQKTGFFKSHLQKIKPHKFLKTIYKNSLSATRKWVEQLKKEQSDYWHAQAKEIKALFQKKKKKEKKEKKENKTKKKGRDNVTLSTPHQPPFLRTIFKEKKVMTPYAHFKTKISRWWTTQFSKLKNGMMKMQKLFRRRGISMVKRPLFNEATLKGGIPMPVKLNGLETKGIPSSGDLKSGSHLPTERPVYTLKHPHWKFKADIKTPYDPLLACLLTVARLKNKPTSARAITSGLPLVNHKLTPALFKRAAARAGLSCRVVPQHLQELTERQLPAILFLDHAQAWVISEVRDDGTAVVIKPEAGDGAVEMPISELAKIYTGYIIFLEARYHFDYHAISAPPAQTKNWFWSVIWKARAIYIEILIASFLLNLFSIASPLFVMNVYDRVVPNNALDTLWVLAFGVIIVFSFDFLLRTLRAYFIDSTARKIDITLSGRTFEQLMDLEMSARPTSVGVLSNTVFAFESFRDFVTSASISLLVDIPFLVLFVGIIAMLGGSIAFVPLLVIPLILFVSFLIHIPLNRLVQESYRYSAEKQSVLIESLSGIETVKSTCSEGHMQNKWENVIRLLARLGVRLRTLSNLGVNFSVYIQHLAVVGVIAVGVYKIAEGDMTIGALIACSILLGRALAPVSQLASLISRYKQSKAALLSLDAVMHMPIERPLDKTFLHRSSLKGDVELQHVAFQYPEHPVAVLNDVSFRIKPGEHVGIIGRTGSGKTTLEKLILKFYPVTSGHVLIDGVDIQQLDPAELRRHIGYVPQDVVLFKGTIRENIVVGASYVDDATLMRAAQLSGVDTFVSHHPQGFDRMVSERGQNLSGGQRQAIAVARALLLDPPVLVFDEPCNSMDDNTLSHFFMQFKNQLASKTLIIITHKAFLLGWIDRLIVLEGGRVLMDGAKEAVLQRLVDRKKASLKKPVTTTSSKTKPVTIAAKRVTPAKVVVKVVSSKKSSKNQSPAKTSKEKMSKENKSVKKTTRKTTKKMPQKTKGKPKLKVTQKTSSITRRSKRRTRKTS